MHLIFWTIKFGRRNVQITSQKLSWNLIGTLFLYRNFWRLGPLTESIFRAVMLFFGFGKRGLLERGLFRKIHFLEIIENLEILEILGNPQSVESKGETDHLEILEILEIPPVKRPLS